MISIRTASAIADLVDALLPLLTEEVAGTFENIVRIDHHSTCCSCRRIHEVSRHVVGRGVVVPGERVAALITVRTVGTNAVATRWIVRSSCGRWLDAVSVIDTLILIPLSIGISNIITDLSVVIVPPGLLHGRSRLWRDGRLTESRESRHQASCENEELNTFHVIFL